MKVTESFLMVAAVAAGLFLLSRTGGKKRTPSAGVFENGMSADRQDGTMVYNASNYAKVEKRRREGVS